MGRLRRLQEDRSCAGVLLTGAAGVGKTHLASAWLRETRAAGYVTERVVATSSAAAIPFGAVSSLLPPFEHGWSLSANRAHLLRASAEMLRSLGRGRRAIISVDDAHLLDEASAALIHHLVVADSAFVVITLRGGVLTPDAIGALLKDNLVERLEVSELDTAAILDLLSVVLDGSLDRADALDLAKRSEGNALFLRELVVGSIQDGTLSCEGGLWRLTRPLSPPSLLIDLLDARLQGLSASEHELLDLISLAEPLDFLDLSRIADLTVAEALETRGLIRIVIENDKRVVRMSHSLYQDVIRARMPVLRHHRLTALLANLFEGSGGGDAQRRLRIAVWRQESGGGTADELLLAARTALELYDLPLAERLARGSVKAGGPFEAALLAARLASLQGRGEQAENELAALGLGALDDDARSSLALVRIENLSYWMGHQDEAVLVLDEAEAAVTDPDRRAEINARRAGVLLAARGPREAAESAQPVFDTTVGRSRVWASLAAGFSFARLGQVDHALEMVKAGSEAFAELDTAFEWDIWWHDFNKVEALSCGGYFHEALSLATLHYNRALETRAVEERAFFGWQLAKLTSELGPIRSTLSYGREAASLFRQLGRHGYVRAALVPVVLAAAYSTPSDARLALDEHEALEVHTPAWLVAEQAVARALAMVAAGDVKRAMSLLEEAAEVGEERGDLVWSAAAMHAGARLGNPQAVLRKLDTLAESAGPLVQLRAEHVRGLVASDPEAIHRTADSLCAIGAIRLAAEGHADAARLWQSQSEPHFARAEMQRCSSLLEIGGFPRTPGTDPSVAGILTRAQEETARLASMGRSNRDIAQELHLSVRTVENRLQQIYERLGLSSRKQLSDLFLLGVPPRAG